MKLSELRIDKLPVPGKGVLIGSAAAVTAAATALWVRRQARKAERDSPPIGRFIEVDGVRLHYIERGEGPPIVLLHGNAVLLQDFIASGLIDALAERHRVIAFDRPGFGYSERPRDRLWTPAAQAALFGQALAQLDVRHPVVLGHSWGTLVALAMALDYPRKVRGLVLVSGYYYPTARLDAAMTVPVALPVLGDLMRHTVVPIAGRLSLGGMAKAMFAPRPVPEAFFGILSRELMLRPGQLGANAEDATFMVPAAAQLEPRYQELRLPIRILAGADDLIVDVQAHAARLHRELPQSELTVVPDTGHMVHYAARDRTVAAAADLAREPVSELRLKAA